MRGLVARRMLMVAAAVTTLVAVAAVTATALVLSATGRGSVGAAVGRAPALDRVVDVSGDLDPEDPGARPAALDTADRDVRAVLDEALAPTLDGEGAVTRRV